MPNDRHRALRAFILELPAITLIATAILIGSSGSPHDSRGAPPAAKNTTKPFDASAFTRYALDHPGDSKQGGKLFFDAKNLGCGRCHKARGDGGNIGPDLSNIGGKYQRSLLCESILEPSRSIVEGYRTTIIARSDGRILTGIVKGESDRDLTLVDADGKLHQILKSEIDERKTGEASIMPSDLVTNLSHDDFTDLIAFLETLRPAGQASAGSDPLGSISLPAGFVVDRIATGITGATALAIAPDGAIFVCEQTGSIRVVKNGSLLPKPFLTIDVDSRWERGVIGIALDPTFSTNRFVYINHVKLRPFPHHRISRFTAAGDIAAPGSERVLFEGDEQTNPGHQGGAIHFGKDGKLYVGVGEQTAGSPAQAMNSLLGKLLRINTDGSIPEDNPFYRTAQGKYRSIWALGLRNPFTFAVQPETGRILINDVGQGTWEEVNEAFAGANYGWPASEGPTTDPRFHAPIYYYPVASISGGAFHPKSGADGFPTRYQGEYFFMDFVRGRIDVLDPDRPKNVETFATGLTRPVDLTFAPDHALYVLVRDAWVVDENFRPHTGSLLRIRFAPANLKPPSAQSNSHHDN